MEVGNLISIDSKKILKYSVSFALCFRSKSLCATRVKLLELGKPSVDVHALLLSITFLLLLWIRWQVSTRTPLYHRFSRDVFPWSASSYHRQNLSIKITVKAYGATCLRESHNSKISEEWNNKNTQPFSGSVLERTWHASLEQRDLNLYLLTLAFCPRFVFKVALVKARLGRGG